MNVQEVLSALTNRVGDKAHFIVQSCSHQKKLNFILKLLYLLVDSSAGLKNKFQLINLDVSFGNLHDSFEAYHLSSFPTHEVLFFLHSLFTFLKFIFAGENHQCKYCYS